VILTLSSAGVCQSTEDLRRLARAELEHLRRVRLEQCDRSAEDAVLIGVRKRLHLVGNCFKPRVGGLDLTRHLRELEPDDRVLDELLSEGLALERVLHGLLDAHASEANRLRRHA
jgi:hypothetical protein